ncbi:hypothetical protein CTEN210_18190 [Chaetoceros tenuissimus]|uniref:HSF-type DNA-binding domain-containing protein n=1 Tax=Chaetoceros tenuissimus TaxID=426638 RepID=A0AAD3HFX6_9STRA|nr:hypothetical protein CTEN210_18190 [Chaetoceros tenuissimus]
MNFGSVSPYQGYNHCYDYHEPVFPSASENCSGERSNQVSPNALASRRSSKRRVEETDQEELPTICTKGGVTAPFPVKLMDLLNLIDTKEPQLASIISWQPSGESFKVRDKKRFVEEVQSLFFTQTNYTSFRRQLNLWGFKRIGDKYNEDCGAYCHPMFKRNDMYACRLMRRPGKESSSQASSQSKSKTKSKSMKATKEARRISLCSKKEEATITNILDFFQDDTTNVPHLWPFTSIVPMNKHDAPVENSTRNHLTLCSTSSMISSEYSCNRSQDHDLNFIVNDDDSNPIILEDEFEPIVDEEKECVLPHEVVVLFLAHALTNSDCL